MSSAQTARLLASAGTDHKNPTVRLWNVASGETHKVFKGNTKYLFFTRDGKRLGFGGVNDLRIVDLDTGKIVRSIGHPSQALASAVLSDGQHTLTDGRSVSGFVRPSRGFHHAALSADGKQICTADGGMMQIWDASTGKEMRVLRGQGNLVAWNPDGRSIATPGEDRCIRIWSMTEDPEGMTLPGHKARVSSLAFTPDGKRLASGSHDHSIKIWDVAAGKEIANLGKHQYHFHRPTLTEPPVLGTIVTLEGHSKQIHDVAYSPDGCWLASASQDKTLRVWDTASGKETLKRPFPDGVSSVAWAPDGKRIAAGSWDDDVHLFEFPSGQFVRKFEGHKENVSAVAFLRDGKVLASAGWDKTVRIWDVDTGRLLNILKSPFFTHLTSLTVSPDERLLAVAGEDMVITLWETGSWKEVGALWGHTARIDNLAFSPDGRRLASVSGAAKNSISITGTVKLWDVTTRLELLDLPGVFAVKFSPDGRQLAAGMSSNDIHIYETAPVDNQSYRTGPYQAPPPDEAQTSDDGKLRVLGFFTAPRLPGVYDAPNVLRPSQDGCEFLVAVLSLPHRFFIPSEQFFQRIVAAAREKGEEPSPRRECITFYTARRFRLLLPKGNALMGELVAVWPSHDLPGFNRGIQWTSSDRVRPHERMALAIAWSVNPKATVLPFRVQVDQDEPVPAPQVRLVPDSRLGPPSLHVLELANRVERAFEKVKTEKYAEAVAASSLAAKDKEAHPVTIYNAGCVHALASTHARQDTKLVPAEREQRAEEYARRAVELVRRAVAKGFNDLAHIKKDRDLDSLRSREDFQKLVGDVEKQK